MPLNSTRNFDLIYVSQTRHKKLNRKEYRCEEDDHYNFRKCIKLSVIKKVGCKMEWDDVEEDFPKCTTMEQIRLDKNKNYICSTRG